MRTALLEMRTAPVRPRSIKKMKMEKKKKNPKTKKETQKWSHDKMLIHWVSLGQKGKYLSLGQDARTSIQIFPRPALPLSQ